jgi:hypothetical protein
VRLGAGIVLAGADSATSTTGLSIEEVSSVTSVAGLAGSGFSTTELFSDLELICSPTIARCKVSISFPKSSPSSIRRRRLLPPNRALTGSFLNSSILPRGLPYCSIATGNFSINSAIQESKRPSPASRAALVFMKAHCAHSTRSATSLWSLVASSRRFVRAAGLLVPDLRRGGGILLRARG